MLDKLEFHHIGLACQNLEKEVQAYKSLSFIQESAIFEDPIQRVRGVFMTNGNFRIELLEALNDNSPINNYLSKGITMYHQCFIAKDLNLTIDYLRNEGAIIVVEPIEAVAFNLKRIAFLYLKNKMLIELKEE